MTTTRRTLLQAGASMLLASALPARALLPATGPVLLTVTGRPLVVPCGIEAQNHWSSSSPVGMWAGCI